MKPATIATQLVAKYGASYASGLAHGRMRLHLYNRYAVNVQRAVVWMTVRQLIDKMAPKDTFKEEWDA